MKNNYHSLHYSARSFLHFLKKWLSSFFLLGMLYAHEVAAGSVISYITVSGNVQSGCSLSAESNPETMLTQGVNVSCDIGVSSSYQFPQISLSTDGSNLEGHASSATTTLLNIGGILSF
jgi:hypothetical protein